MAPFQKGDDMLLDVDICRYVDYVALFIPLFVTNYA